MKRRLQSFFAFFLLGLLALNNLVFLSNLVVATTVKGDIIEDTVWTVAGSPYVVESNVTVKSGATLTIEADVKVLFNENVSLVVKGSLLVNGTADERVTFSLNRNESSNKNWLGIVFVGEETEFLIVRHANVRYAKNGITIKSLGKVVIENSDISLSVLNGIQIVGQGNILLQKNVLLFNENGIHVKGNVSAGIQVISNLIRFNNKNGVYFNISDAIICRVYNVTIIGNQIEWNRNGVYFYVHAKEGQESTQQSESSIYNVTISKNIIASSVNGIFLHTQAWWYSKIYDLTISKNLIYFNDNGVTIDSDSKWSSWISKLTISGNKIFANGNGTLLDAFSHYVSPDPFAGVPFDVILTQNTFSANNGTGIKILGDVNANFTDNSIAYNLYGVYIDSLSQDNIAHYNDIYQNFLYGMYLVEGGSINAENNYWGDPSGPYHQSANPNGKGNQVFGNVKDLDFDPFLKNPVGLINTPPVAKLEVSAKEVLVNQTLIFNASASYDDTGSVVWYFYDFGNGKNSGWIRNPLFDYRYVSQGLYNVSLIVMDNLGVKSINPAVETVNVSLPSLTVSIMLYPPGVVSGGNVLVKVHVSNGSANVENAFVRLTSDLGGNFDPPSGYTGSNGYFNSTYFAPKIAEPANAKITASVSKRGYQNATRDFYLSILPPGSTVGFNPLWIWFGFITGVILIVFIVKKKRVKAKP
jgi:hypothetical protein